MACMYRCEVRSAVSDLHDDIKNLTIGPGPLSIVNVELEDWYCVGVEECWALGSWAGELRPWFSGPAFLKDMRLYLRNGDRHRCLGFCGRRGNKIPPLY